MTTLFNRVIQKMNILFQAKQSPLTLDKEGLGSKLIVFSPSLHPAPHTFLHSYPLRSVPAAEKQVASDDDCQYNPFITPPLQASTSTLIPAINGPGASREWWRPWSTRRAANRASSSGITCTAATSVASTSTRSTPTRVYPRHQLGRSPVTKATSGTGPPSMFRQWAGNLWSVDDIFSNSLQCFQLNICRKSLMVSRRYFQ